MDGEKIEILEVPIEPNRAALSEEGFGTSVGGGDDAVALTCTGAGAGTCAVLFTDVLTTDDKATVDGDFDTVGDVAIFGVLATLFEGDTAVDGDFFTARDALKLVYM